MFFGVFVQALLEVGAILAMSLVAMSVAAPERLLGHPATQLLLAQVPALNFLGEDLRRVALACAVLSAALIAAKNAVSALVTHQTNVLGERIALFAGDVIFHNFLYSPYIRHLSGDSNIMFNALTRRAELGRLMVHLMAVYSYALVSLVMTLALLVFTPGPVLVVMGGIMIIAVLLYRRLRTLMDSAGRESNARSSDESRATLNAMRGIRELLIYRQQEVFYSKFETACIEGAPPRAFLSIAPTMPTWILESAGFIAIVAAMGVMWGLLDAPLPQIAGVLTIIILIAWRVLPLFNRSLSALVIVRGTRPGAMECLDKVEEALGETDAARVEPAPDFALHEGITLEDAAFRYPRAEHDSLSGISFTIPCGARVGIIGQSGAGKSTLAAILSGLVEPSSGAFLVDGQPLSPEGRAAYCERIGYVPQNPYILAGSIAENVAFSQWGKPWDEERVVRACRMASLDVAFERGIESGLGEGGAGLSGGQMQRVAIARALYAEPAVLILDEATSALDSGVEAGIMNTIFALPAGITTIIIAHRLSTVERCDTLFWIEDGRLHAVGTPAEILPAYKASLAEAAARKAAEEAEEKAGETQAAEERQETGTPGTAPASPDARNPEAAQPAAGRTPAPETTPAEEKAPEEACSPSSSSR
ncbi:MULTISPECIES: ABC transporter ATP-binding protein [unclassified Desulfovibrio]|uniref:ATP-binding cassette domain-containing protein n=1 Tax=unclassified Desulfovibrio TaxID=2593640 RepID=UPI001F151698|nr:MULTISPECIES: ABC transporter ATP-binding protein [unclassified Desulfovibrio]